MLSLRTLALKATFVLTACGAESPTAPNPNPNPGPGTPVPVASVTLSATELTLALGNTIQLTATARDQSGAPLTGRMVTWQSSSPDVVTVTNGDRLTAVGHGTAIVTATVEGKSAQMTMRVPEVTPAVAALVVGESEIIVPLGMARFPDVAPVDAEGRYLPNVTITWESLDEQVASVTPGGAVMTHRVGTTTILARAGQKEAAISITVTPYPSSTPIVSYALDAVDGGQLGTTIWSQLLEEGPNFTTWRFKRLMGGAFTWDVTTHRYVLTLRMRTATATSFHNGGNTIVGAIVDEVVTDEGTIGYRWPGSNLLLTSVTTPGLERSVELVSGTHLRATMDVPGSSQPRTLEFRRP